ncbi:putative hydroxymethylpyrimidine transport system ATP-binding protein [Kushneria avicenniae]|uniref:Putative hydroxymethylpyrimidine transport system ATP-binding protein n=1 Tax=Kushneria avicenniae TaxID=402385 RepID=A0A1I1FT41_9GAMM|nr:ABC transporter ATP-binding protein [Kushneria avicenniae]SFC00140.1 putative hydroxymethylpyrimidine transport system ATP-binding protein [Kushneria avicenniae]
MQHSRHKVSTDAHAPGALHVQNARLAFGERVLFDDISLSLPSASWSCLLGRSGCGKSSLLRLMAGLEVSNDAQLTLEDASQRPWRQRIAWMGQQDLLLPWRRVIDNVQLGSTMRGERSDPERAMALLERTGLDWAARRYPQTLSGGERARVALARTLYEQAPLVLMDEPFAALDALTRLDIHERACELLADRMVVMVTHDPIEALRLGDQLLVMRGSPARIEHFAPPEGTPPRHPATDSMSRHHDDLLKALTEQTA